MDVKISYTVQIMTGPSAPGKSRTATAFNAPLRSAIVLVLIVSGVFSQTPQPRSEEDRVAEMKRRVIETLHLRPGDTAADVGCGDGFYTIPLARSLGPSGKVFAVDIDDGELLKLKQHLAEDGLKNVEVMKGAEDDPRLPTDSVDGTLIVNAYHEMRAHDAMLRHIRAALKQGGVLVVMEGISDIRETKPRDEQVKHHQLAPQVVKQEVEKAASKL
jgi:ubiquinone/menaquinone biosynthesis C-methylase UbiE